MSEQPFEGSLLPMLAWKLRSLRAMSVSILLQEKAAKPQAKKRADTKKSRKAGK